MRFQVLWASEAEQELAAVWLAARDRSAINRASRVIDHLLAVDPEHAGESRDRGRRILFESPLAAVYRISIPDQTVLVLSVWHYGKRREDDAF